MITVKIAYLLEVPGFIMFHVSQKKSPQIVEEIGVEKLT